MANRITVTICGEDYTLMAEESPSYMQKVAALVDAKMSEMMASGRVQHGEPPQAAQGLLGRRQQGEK